MAKLSGALKRSRANDIGATIRRARKAKKLSLGDLATEIEVTPQAISLWELGRAAPNAHNVFALARALDIDPGTLVP